jgi:hypothetical protein
MVEYKKKKILLQTGGTRNFYYKVKSDGKKKQVSKKEYLEKKGGGGPFNPIVTQTQPIKANMNKIREELNKIKPGTKEETNFLMSYNPQSFWHKETKNRLKKNYVNIITKNTSTQQQINKDLKYGDNPLQYQIHLAKIREGSKSLTNKESNNLKKKRQEEEIQQQKEKDEIMRQHIENRRKRMSNGEIYKIEVYEPAKKSLEQKLNIPENDLEFSDKFIPKFKEYISNHNKNSNITSKINDMCNYTKIWQQQQEYDNLRSREEIPYPMMKPIWEFQKKYKC